MAANTSNGVVINRLPSPTWNRLGVNRAYVNFDELPQVEASAVYTEANTEQIQKEVKTTAEAIAWADGMSGGIRREATIAGKRAIYQEQAFATGLGGDYTNLIASLVETTDVYTIEENQKVAQPIILSWNFGQGGKACAQQIIYAKKDSEVTFLMVQESDKSAAGHAAFETKVILEEGATVHLMKVNLLGENFVLLDDAAAIVADHASFDFTQMELGGAKSFVGCYADECGRHAHFNVNTGYMADQDHLVDINYVACQRGVKSDSRIYVKGSLKDNAKKIFRGTIDFRKGAKGAVGDEQEDVLLLDPRVTNKTVPVILTEEEDVDGRHGATIGNLSEDILFYLGNRGIGKEAAEMLMTRGRLLSVANLIPDEETVRKISAFIREAFETND